MDPLVFIGCWTSVTGGAKLSMGQVSTGVFCVIHEFSTQICLLPRKVFSPALMLATVIQVKYVEHRVKNLSHKLILDQLVNLKFHCPL